MVAEIWVPASEGRERLSFSARHSFARKIFPIKDRTLRLCGVFRLTEILYCAEFEDIPSIIDRNKNVMLEHNVHLRPSDPGFLTIWKNIQMLITFFLFIILSWNFNWWDLGIASITYCSHLVITSIEKRIRPILFLDQSELPKNLREQYEFCSVILLIINIKAWKSHG